MKLNILKMFLLGILICGATTSCRKDSFVDKDNELGTKGSTYVRLQGGPEKSVFLDAATGISPVKVFTILRDANSQESLSTATTISLTAAPELIAAYNTAHATTYETLPESIYTLGTGISKSGTAYNVSLNAGDFARDFRINLNFAAYDFSKKYALAFKISSAGNGVATSTGEKTIIAFISVKNAWDGIYSMEAGSIVTRYTNPTTPANDALSGVTAGNPDIQLSTLNATTVLISNLRWAGGTSGVAGIDNLQATIDPSTNLVTMKALGNASLANIPGKVNKYDPTTKTFTLNFDWNQTANKREMTLVVKYKSAR